jgi:hypothetical protein
MPARNLTDLPVELLSEIVNYLRPSLDDRPEIGVNAAWTEMDGPIYCEESEPSDESDEDTSEETDAQQDDHEVEIEGEGEGESEDENDDEDEVEVDATNPPTPTDSSRANTISVTEGSPEADEPNLQLSTYAVTTNSLGSNTKPMLKSEESLSPSNEVLAKGLASLFALRLYVDPVAFFHHCPLRQVHDPSKPIVLLHTFEFDSLTMPIKPGSLGHRPSLMLFAYP